MAREHEFSLSSLLPEPLVFRDDRFGGDGALHDVKTAGMLSVEDVVVLERLQRRGVEAVGRTDLESGSQAAMLAQATDEMMGLLVPTLPAERLKAIPFAFKAAFLKWWREKQPQPEETDAGEAQAGE